MFNITIKITGPGAVINYEAAIVIAALKMEGFEVEVVNDHPPEDQEVVLNRRRALRFSDPNRKDKVKVIVDHQPWGG